MSAILWYVVAFALVAYAANILSFRFVAYRPNPGWWTPPTFARTLSGDAIPSEMRFFGPPPEDIGDIIFAESTLRSDSDKPGFIKNFDRAMTCGVIGLVLGVVMVYWGNLWESPWRFFWWSVPAVSGFAGGWQTRINDACYFVGMQGVAAYRAYPGGELVLRQPLALIVFPYNLTLESRGKLVSDHNETTGIETVTWFNEKGFEIGKIKTHDGKHGEMRKRFARVAVDAWELHCILSRLLGEETRLKHSRSHGFGYQLSEGITREGQRLIFHYLDSEGKVSDLSNSRVVLDFSDEEKPRVTEWPHLESLHHVLESLIRGDEFREPALNLLKHAV